MCIASQIQKLHSLLHEGLIGILVLLDFAEAAVLLRTPLVRHFLEEGRVYDAVELVDIHGVDAILKPLVFSLMALDRLFVFTPLVCVAGVQRIAHPLQHLIIELEPPKEFCELRLQHFLADISAAAGGWVSSALISVACAMVIDVALLFDLPDYSASASMAGDHLKSRNPRYVPPRVVSGPTLLAGRARCGYCGAALTLNTGKGGAYRYYCCSRKLKEGRLSCQGLRIRMDRLDEIVIGELSAHILNPSRLRSLLDAYLQSASERADRERSQLDKLRHNHREIQARLSRLLDLVELGQMNATDPNLKDRLSGLMLQRDELAADIANLQHRIASGEPEITGEKIERFASLLRDKLQHGDPAFRQA